MKKALAIMLAALLLCGGALAETLYKSPDGYSLNYPQERLVLRDAMDVFAPADGGGDISLVIVPANARPEESESLLAEAVSGYAGEYSVSEAHDLAMEMESVSARAVEVLQNGRIDRYYLIVGEEIVLCATATFPLEAAEGYGARFDRVIASISFTSPGEAGTRTGTIMIEGLQEEIVETRFASELGYFLWYPADSLAATPGSAHTVFVPGGGAEGASLTIVRTEVPVEEADSLLAEAAGGFGEAAEIGAERQETLASGANLRSVEVAADGVVYCFYIVKGEEIVLAITAQYPQGDAEGYGACFDAMVKSISF